MLGILKAVFLLTETKFLSMEYGKLVRYSRIANFRHHHYYHRVILF